MKIRKRIQRGIYADQYGVAVCVKSHGRQREKRFPLGTPIETLAAARLAMQSAPQRERTAASSNLDRNPYRFGYKECFVYFVQDGDAIKIGRASDVKRRLSSMQTSNSRPLTLLKVVRAVDCDELDLHKRFEHLRIPPTREWFRMTEELQHFISGLSDSPS
jgi:hypothetical protein